MQHYMPEIFWHDRSALLSVDINPVIRNNKYRIVTSSMQKEVRIWEFSFEKSNQPVDSLAVDFVANLKGHNTAVNVVRFMPVEPGNMLASGDSDGRVVIWQLSDQPGPPTTVSPDDELPPNKEHWVRLRNLSHDEDIATVSWSPDGRMIATVSRDNCLLIHEASSGKRVVSLRSFRQFPNGLAWDPRGKYIVTLSTDRKMDLIDCQKGTKLRSFGMADLPGRSICGLYAEAKPYRLFHDDQLPSFQRGISFSPCGELIIAPAGHLEIGTQDVFGTFVFKRTDIDKDKPLCFLPSSKPTFLVRTCPVLMELKDSEENYSGLPYRVLWLALTKDAVFFYDSQHSHPIGYVDNIHYNNLTDAAWSSDGKNVIVSSLEGYNSFLRFNVPTWGAIISSDTIPPPPPSPQLIQVRKRKAKQKDVKDGEQTGSTTGEGLSEPEVPGTPKGSKLSGIRTPIGSAPTTPKPASLKKFFLPRANDENKNNSDTEKAEGRGDKTPDTKAADSAEGELKPTPTVNTIDVRKKKRIQLVTLED